MLLRQRASLCGAVARAQRPSSGAAHPQNATMTSLRRTLQLHHDAPFSTTSPAATTASTTTPPPELDEAPQFESEDPAPEAVAPPVPADKSPRKEAHTVPLVRVDRDNFSEAKAALDDALKTAAFVCIDCEFTGLTREKQQGHIALQSLAKRYEAHRRSLSGPRTASSAGSNAVQRHQGYLIVQVGFAVFGWNEKLSTYEVSVFSFYLSPKPGGAGEGSGNVRVDNDLHFGCLASAVSFLSQHGFDFNRWAHKGVPFMSRARYYEERDRLELRGRFADVEDLDERKGFLDAWDAVLRAGVPVVGHQCLLDVLYLWKQLEGPLPKSLAEFLTGFNARVKLVVDTKHIVSGFPTELKTVVERQLSLLKSEKLSRNAVALAAKEAACRDLLRLLQQKGTGLRHLTLVELYHLFSPFAGPAAPALENGIAAHDAGGDAFMTGVLFVGFHNLCHPTHPCPTAAFIAKHHAAAAPAAAAAGARPPAFPFANNLHVFASPQPLHLSPVLAVPPFHTTHRNTVVVLPSPGCVLESARLMQVLSTVNPNAEVYWIEYQRIAVVSLHSSGSSDVVLQFIAAAQPNRWKVERAIAWTARRKPGRRKKKPPKSKPGDAAPLRRRRPRQRRRRQAAADAGALARAKESDEMQSRLLEARQLAAQRLQELMDSQRDLKKLQLVEREFEESKKQWLATNEILTEVESVRAQLATSKTTLETHHEALKKETDALTRGVEHYRAREETLRRELASELQKSAKLESFLKEAESKAQVAEMKIEEAVARTRAVQQAASAAPPAAEKRSLLKPRRSLSKDSNQAGRDQGKLLSAAGAFAAEEASKGDAAKKSSDPHARKAQTRVEEIRAGQWVVERKEGKKDDPVHVILVVEPKRNQNLELRECRHVVLLMEGTLGSLSLTGCEHVTVYCESAVTEPSASKSWSWNDTNRVSGPRIFYYGGDKSTINVEVQPKEKWPAGTARKAETYLASRVLKDRAEQAQKKLRQADLIRHMAALALVLCLYQILASSIIASKRQQQHALALAELGQADQPGEQMRSGASAVPHMMQQQLQQQQQQLQQQQQQLQQQMHPQQEPSPPPPEAPGVK